MNHSKKTLLLEVIGYTAAAALALWAIALIAQAIQ